MDGDAGVVAVVLQEVLDSNVLLLSLMFPSLFASAT